MVALVLIFTILSVHVLGQDDPTVATQPIVAEGKLLYKSEMASWYGTDLFLEKYKDRSAIGGYFSYQDQDLSKCIFFSRTERPRVIGTISFDSTHNLQTAIVDMSERDFSKTEQDL